MYMSKDYSTVPTQVVINYVRCAFNYTAFAVLVLYLFLSEKRSITSVLVRNFASCLALAGIR